VEQPSVLECYERALECTRAMHAAAQKGDWDALVQHEKERAVLIDRLGREDADPAGEPASRNRKRELIAAMLQLDQQIQLLTQDWMHELREVLGSISAEQRLNRTYGP
jgi:hypothetical protein